MRFLSLDLNYGKRVDSTMYEYLLDNGMTREEYHFFLDNRLKQHCILGNDYYATNEHRVSADGSTRYAGEIFGYDEITRQYYDRYRLPVMHTETNIAQGPKGDEAVNWLWKEWANVLRVRNDGVPIVGFTWYSLTDQVDWDTALREQNHRVNPLGLYDLDRNIRPVGECYKTAHRRLARGAADAERVPRRAGGGALEGRGRGRARAVPAGGAPPAPSAGRTLGARRRLTASGRAGRQRKPCAGRRQAARRPETKKPHGVRLADADGAPGAAAHFGDEAAESGVTASLTLWAPRRVAEAALCAP